MISRALLLLAMAASCVAVQVTVSNTRLPLDNNGDLLKTGELDILMNLERDGYVYFYASDWGCVRQVSCCTSSAPWPSNNCWTCCPAQRAAAYQANHTIQAYRTRDFATWENLGVLIGIADRAAGAMFVPRVLYNPTTAQYVMWFENYSGSKTPVGGEYSVAVSARPDRDFRVVIDRPHSASFACGTSQGDFDLFIDPDIPSVAYVVNTYYDHFCIEELNSEFTGGTGRVAKVTAMDPTIEGHPPGDEAPAVFKRGEWFYLTYASGCCGCVGGSITWQHRSKHPLGPWEQIGSLLTPNGPVTRAQQRAVFRVPAPPTQSTPDGGWTYIHIGNQWGSSITPAQRRLPQGGVEGTCEDHALLYWWILAFDANDSIVPRTTFDRSATFEMLPPAPLSACASVVPLPQDCNETASSSTGKLGGGDWTLFANLSDPASAFSASALIANFSTTSCGGVAIKLDDTSSKAFSSATKHFLALGVPSANPALRAKAAAWGASAAPAIAGVAEAYTLVVNTSASHESIFLLGEDSAGAFYAVQTLLQVGRASSSCDVPELSIVDYPDLELRGGEFESSFDVHNQTTWWHSVADEMASLKLNWVLYDTNVGLTYDWSTEDWTEPSAVSTRAHLENKRYFEERHIKVCMVIGAKYDPRTLEAKAVTGEPFVFADGSDIATALTPSATGDPINGDFEDVHNVTLPGGGVALMPVGWTFEKGSHNWSGIPCSLDEVNKFSGKRSVKCDIQRFPDPDPFIPPPHDYTDNNNNGARTLQHPLEWKMENPGFNYSGPITSDLFEIQGGSLYSLEYSASWRGNWSGAFTAAVIILQYKTKEEASAAADENPTSPTWPFAQSFLPCQGGDARQCTAETVAIPELPKWGTYHKSLITMPEARYMRLKSLVPGWGAGQYWIDDLKISRIDAELKNVVHWPSRPHNDSGIVVVDASSGKQLKSGSDYEIIDPPAAAAYNVIGNLTALQPLKIRRLKESIVAVNVSFNVLPGNEGNIVGGRDVSCFVDPAYESLSAHAIAWVIKTYAPLEYLVPDGFDEQMGMGRDSRTLASGLTNAEIIARAINFLHGAIKSAAPSTQMAIWADMLVPDHNGGTNYSFINGGGRPQPYWPAIKDIPDDVLLLSWIYDTSTYAQKLIRDSPDFFHNYSKQWVGSGWTEVGNIDLWAGALLDSKARYGAKSTARGLIDTNWGGGHFETGLVPVARRGWNLRSSSSG